MILLLRIWQTGYLKCRPTRNNLVSYTKRTCHQCRFRTTQPDMHKIEAYAETGKSKQGISAATVLGATLFGSKKSHDSLTRWLFNTNQRTYQRKKIVWSCDTCIHKEKKFTFLQKVGVYFTVLVGFFFFFVLL